MASGADGPSAPRPRGRYKLRGQRLSALPNTDLVPAPKPQAVAKPRVIAPRTAQSVPAQTGPRLAMFACLAIAALSGAAYLVLSARSGAEVPVAAAAVAVEPVMAAPAAAAPSVAEAVPPVQVPPVKVSSAPIEDAAGEAASVEVAPAEVAPAEVAPVQVAAVQVSGADAAMQSAPVAELAVTADPVPVAAPVVATALPALVPPASASGDTVLPAAAAAMPQPAAAPDLPDDAGGMPAAFSCVDCTIPQPDLAGLLVKAYHPSGVAGDRMAAELRALGAGEVSVAAAGLVPASNQVRYFLPDDRPAAEILADHFGAIVVDLTWYAPAPPAAQVEIWIAE